MYGWYLLAIAGIATWCHMVPHGATWCHMVPHGATRFSVWVGLRGLFELLLCLWRGAVWWVRSSCIVIGHLNHLNTIRLLEIKDSIESVFDFLWSPRSPHPLHLDLDSFGYNVWMDQSTLWYHIWLKRPMRIQLFCRKPNSAAHVTGGYGLRRGTSRKVTESQKFKTNMETYIWNHMVTVNRWEHMETWSRFVKCHQVSSIWVWKDMKSSSKIQPCSDHFLRPLFLRTPWSRWQRKRLNSPRKCHSSWRRCFSVSPCFSKIFVFVFENSVFVHVHLFIFVQNYIYIIIYIYIYIYVCV